MVIRYIPNSDPWGHPGNPFMTICVFYVNPQTPNIEYFEAYEVYKSQEVSHLFLIKFPVEWRQNHVWGTIFDPSYDHMYKCDYFGYTDGRTSGRSDGRTVGRVIE